MHRILLFDRTPKNAKVALFNATYAIFSNGFMGIATR